MMDDTVLLLLWSQTMIQPDSWLRGGLVALNTEAGHNKGTGTFTASRRVKERGGGKDCAWRDKIRPGGKGTEKEGKEGG